MEASLDLLVHQRDTEEDPTAELSPTAFARTSNGAPLGVHSKSSAPTTSLVATTTVSTSPRASSERVAPVSSPQEEPRAPELPNLAKEALERLKNKRESAEDSEDDDFKPLKKKKADENSEPHELQTCSICFEPWSNSGSHRIASLKCGHLFGLVCIEKWLRSAGSAAKCPQCNLKAKRSDVRVVFAKAVSVQDTTERDHALRELEQEKQLRIQAQRDEAQALLQQNLARSECDRLKEEVRRLKAQLEFYTSKEVRPSSSSTGSSAAEESVAGRYSPLHAITVTENQSARVMAYDAEQGALVVSKYDHATCGDGIQKFSAIDFQHSEYVGLHCGTIRDMSFRPHSQDGLLLTAALDKTAKLTSVKSNTVVRSFDLPCAVWACCWDQDETSYFHCGLQNGSVVTFDVRSPSKQVGALARSKVGGSPPITSLASVPRSVSSSLNCGGLLASSLGGCLFWEKSNSSSSMTGWMPHNLTSLPEGPCPSVSFEPSTRHCFATFRPTKRLPLVKHVLFQLHNVPTDQPLSCQPIHQFQGGSTQRLLSRSKLFLHPDNQDRLLALYGKEYSKTVHICDVSSTLEFQQLSLVKEPMLDVATFSGSGGLSHLALLTNTSAHLYKWNQY